MSLSTGLSLSRNLKIPKYKSRKSVHLDGANDYFVCTDDTAFNHDSGGTSKFTLSLWFKADVGSGTLGDVRTLVAKNVGSNKEFVLYLKTDRTLNLIVTADGSTDLNNDLGYTVSDTNWHHVIVGYNGSLANEVIVKVDGVAKSVTQNASNPTGIHEGAGDFYIGSVEGANDFWDGYIDEVD